MHGTSFSSVQLITGLSPFGVGIHATVRDLCWIESEQSFVGKTEDGTRYFVWNITKEGKSRDYRRVVG